MKRSCLLLLGLLLLGPFSVLAQETRILIVGDSWAEEMWEDGSHEVVFASNNLNAFGVDGSTTTESGSTAAEWKQASYLQRVTDALVAQPTIDIVQLTVGGNDFLGVWNTDFTEPELDALKNAILTDLTIITDHLLGKDPELDIVLSFYDYPNFVDTLGGLIGFLFCNPLYNSLGQPTPQQINDVALEFESLYADLADNNPRIHFASHFGLMQFNYGFPDDGIPPGALEPPGDLSLPSPVESMRLRSGLGRDCFHLEAAGYDILVQNLVDNYYLDRLLGVEAGLTLTDLDQTYNGSPRPVTVETDPPGLNVLVTYDGSEQAPVDAGSYAVVAQVDESGWFGETTATLVVESASQTLDFQPLPDLPVNAEPVMLSADASSGLPVTFTLISGPASLDGELLVLDGTPGTVVVEAGQPGDDNWLAAEPVQRSFDVNKVVDPIFRDRFEVVIEP